LLGKWSLLDAFVISVLVGTVQLGILSEASAEPGIYLYLAAILLSLLATFLLRPLTSSTSDGRDQLRRSGLWLTLPSALVYGLGLSLPLLKIEKGFFWESEFSILLGSRRMFESGEYALAISLLLFVVLVPTLRFVGLVILRARPHSGARAVETLRAIDRWSMLDVFALSMMVVVTKLGAFATVEPRIGMWCVFAAALMSGADSLLLQQSPATDRTAQDGTGATSPSS
jgi:paraquat-inducible protein A